MDESSGDGGKPDDGAGFASAEHPGSSGTFSGVGNGPPDLMLHSGAPRFDVQELANIVGIPASILWGWEQNLGVPRPIRVPDDRGGSVPRYSDRDVLAVQWLSEQLRLGVPPLAAARRLLAAQQSPTTGLRPWQIVSADPPNPPNPPNPPASPPPSPGPVTRDLRTSGTFAPSTPSLRGTSGPLPSAGLTGDTSSALGSGIYQGPARTSGPLAPGARSAGATGSLGSGVYPQVGGTFGPLDAGGSMPGAPVPGRGAGAASRTSRPLGYSPQVASTSGPLRGGAGTGFSSPSLPLQGVGAGSAGGSFAGVPRQPRTAAVTGGLPMLHGALLRAFATLDVAECRSILDEAFRDYALEKVYLRLVQPAVARVSEMAEAGQLSRASERFAYVTVRNRLAGMLDAAGAPSTGPVALVACAPGEYHELGPLALTVMWRQAGLRAIYLGPDVHEDALVSEARAHRPALVCLSAATDAATKAIAHVAATFARIDAPRPIFGFGGAAFARTPPLQARVRDGLFLGVDAPTATRHVFQLLQDGPIDGPAHRRF